MNSSSNITRSFFSCFSVPGDTDLVRTVKIMAILLVGGFAVFGNILIIFLAARFTVKRNIHHLIINMAVADILVVLFFSYEMITSVIDLPNLWNLWDNEVVANILCKSYEFFKDTFTFVTSTTLLIISVERFRSTKLTVHRVRPYTMKKRLALVSCSWLLPMGLSIYNVWNNKVKQQGNIRVCYVHNLMIYSIFFTFTQVCVIFMMCLVVIFNIMTSFRLWKSRQTFQGNLSDEQNRTRGIRTAKAVKMVLCSLLLYSCCYVPSFLFEFSNALHMFNVGPVFKPNFWCSIDIASIYFVLNFLFVFNSCFSPCIYFVFLTEFREAAKMLMSP